MRRPRAIPVGGGAAPVPPNDATAKEHTNSWSFAAFRVTVRDNAAVSVCALCEAEQEAGDRKPEDVRRVAKSGKRWQFERHAQHIAMASNGFTGGHGITTAAALQGHAVIKALTGAGATAVDVSNAFGYRQRLAELVADCALPISIVEHPSFRLFISAARKLPAGPTPSLSAKTVHGMMQERAAAATKDLQSRVMGKSVSIGLDAGTNHHRFVGVVIRVHDHDRDGVPLCVAKSYLMKIVADTQPPFTTADVVVVDAPVEVDEEEEEEDDGSDDDDTVEAVPADADDVDDDAAIPPDEEDTTQGKLTSAKLAEFTAGLAKLLKSWGCKRVLGICADNGSNFRHLEAGMRAHGVIINAVSCFAHVGQLFGQTLFGSPTKKALVASLQTATVIANNYRKRHKSAKLPEPVITRWNSWFKLVAEILRRYDKPPEEARRKINVDMLLESAPGRSEAQIIASLRVFHASMLRLKIFTDVVQRDNSTVADGVEVLGLLYEMSTDRHMTNKTLYERVFKDRLTNSRANFMSVPVVLYMAFAPWKVVATDAARADLGTVIGELLQEVDVYGADRAALAQQADKFLRSGFGAGQAHPVSAAGYESFWREVLRNDDYKALHDLARFVLTISHMQVSEAAVERVFSGLKHTVYDRRNRMLPENVADLLTVKWRDGLSAPSVVVVDEPEERKLNLSMITFALQQWMASRATVQRPVVPAALAARHVPVCHRCSQPATATTQLIACRGADCDRHLHKTCASANSMCFRCFLA